MPAVTKALAAAIYFDHELSSNLEPLAALTADLTAAGGSFRQWHIDVDNRKAPPPTRFDLDKMIGRVRKGETSVVGVETEPGTRDEDSMVMTVGTTPVAERPERYALTRCRYEAIIALGATRVECLESVIEFADAVSVRAGAIFVADSATYAIALAAGGGGLSLSAADVDRITNGLIGRSRWGDIIRGPAWGTFLGAAHVERLGGMDRIARESGLARVVALSSGGAYLQASLHPSEEVPPDLIRYLEPVR
jgi:hypothetical protein